MPARQLASNLSEGVCIEGKNSIALNGLRSDGEQHAVQRQRHVPGFHHDLSVHVRRRRLRHLRLHDDRGQPDQQKRPRLPRDQHPRDHHPHGAWKSPTRTRKTCCSPYATTAGTVRAIRRKLNADFRRCWKEAFWWATIRQPERSPFRRVPAFTGSISGEITNSRGETVSTQVGEVSVTLRRGPAPGPSPADSCVTSFTGDAAQVISGGYTLYVDGVALEGTR